MIDRYLLVPQHRLLKPVADWLSRRISADQLTLAGFAVGCCAAGFAAIGWFAAALCAVLINRLADGLDGEVARCRGVTSRGAFLDITCDFIFYALFPLGFALFDPLKNALPAALLLASFMGTGASFLAFSAVASTKGSNAGDYPGKGIPYLGGLTEGAETIAFFVLICLFPASFPWLATGFACACALTTISRMVAGWRAFVG